MRNAPYVGSFWNKADRLVPIKATSARAIAFTQVAVDDISTLCNYVGSIRSPQKYRTAVGRKRSQAIAAQNREWMANSWNAPKVCCSIGTI